MSDRNTEHHLVAIDCASLLIHGQCLATARDVKADLSRYVKTGQVEELLRWPGAYSIIVARAGTDLTIAADLAGQFPVYFAVCATGFWFASDATRLARATDAEVDRLGLGAHLLGLVNPVLTGQLTLLSGVCQVEAESAVRIDHRNQLQRIDVSIPTDAVPSLEACADTFRDQLTTAVRLRAELVPERSMSADLSGGVDSTSLAFLVAGSRGSPLPVFTYHSAAAPVRSDLARATAVADESKVFDHRIVRGTAAQSPFQDLAEAPSADLPSTAIIVFARSRLRFAAAAEAGSVLHLTGDGGDLLAGPVPAVLADFAACGDFGSLWRQSGSWARLRNRPTARLVLRSVRVGSRSPRQALLHVAAGLCTPSPSAGSRTWEDAIGYWGAPERTAAWLTVRTRASVADFLRARAEDAVFPARWRPSDYAIRTELAAGGPVQRGLRAAAAMAGMELHAPYLDSEIIRTCLSLTAALRTNPHEYKPLFRRALAGAVPPSVLEHGAKGDYTRDQYVGLRRSAPLLRALLQAPIAADLGVLEPRPLMAALDRAVLGLDVPWPALTRAVATEIWLRRFHRLPAVPAGTGS